MGEGGPGLGPLFPPWLLPRDTLSDRIDARTVLVLRYEGRRLRQRHLGFLAALRWGAGGAAQEMVADGALPNACRGRIHGRLGSAVEQTADASKLISLKKKHSEYKRDGNVFSCSL